MAALSLKAGGPIIKQHGVGHNLMGKLNSLLLPGTQVGCESGEGTL